MRPALSTRQVALATLVLGGPQQAQTVETLLSVCSDHSPDVAVL